LSVNREELGKKVDSVEVRRGILGGLAQDKEGDRAEDNWPGGNAGRFGFLELINMLAGVEFEFNSIREFGDDIVVVGIEPLLHFTSWDVDISSLSTTAHREEDIEIRKIVVAITVRDDVESKRMIKDMIVKSEISTWDVVDTPLLERGPVGLFYGGGDLGEVFGRRLACPVGLDGFFNFTISTDAGES